MKSNTTSSNSTLGRFYEIDEDIYQRFDAKNHMIYRPFWDKTLPTYRQMFFTNIEKHIKSNKEGYTRFDFAFVKAGWTVYNEFPFAFAWKREKLIPLDEYGTKWAKPKISIENLHDFTKKVKRVAKLYGASLVGIADVNKKWIYNTGLMVKALSKIDMKQGVDKSNKNGTSFLNKPIKLPEGINKVIVMAIEMDPEGISTSPTQPSSASTAIAYSKMAFSISCMGEFMRNLGYRAIQCGNDTALSIPLAIDAGLGALGRSGLLITPEYGPRVRICKVFTDLPLISDKPNSAFIEKMNKTCRDCYKCADVCENDAITKEKEPKFKGESISNNSGVKKYYVNAEKCFEFWVENSGDCGTCIAVCPFSKIKKTFSPSEFWNKE